MRRTTLGKKWFSGKKTKTFHIQTIDEKWYGVQNLSGYWAGGKRYRSLVKTEGKVTDNVVFSSYVKSFLINASGRCQPQGGTGTGQRTWSWRGWSSDPARRPRWPGSWRVTWGEIRIQQPMTIICLMTKVPVPHDVMYGQSNSDIRGDNVSRIQLYWYKHSLETGDEEWCVSGTKC